MSTKLGITFSCMAFLGALIASMQLSQAAVIQHVPGEQRSWSIEFRMELEQPGRMRPIQLDVRGDWISTVSAVRPGEYDAALQLTNLRVTGEAVNSVPDEAKKELKHRWERTYWATYRDGGALTSLHFFKDVNPSDRNLLQMIATEVQFVRADTERPVWTVLERDGAGEYLAIYNVLDRNTVMKRKLKYLQTQPAGAPTDGLQITIERSELRFKVDAKGETLAVGGDNCVRIGVPIEGVHMTAMTETHLSNLRSSRAPELVSSLARALPDVVSSPVVTHKLEFERMRAESDDWLLANYTTKSLLQEAIAQKDDPMLPHRLAALFRQRPDAAPASLAVLREKGPQKRITDALGVAGSPAAIETLASIARDQSLPSLLRIDAITAFVLIQHPSVDAMRFPVSLMDDDNARIASASRLTCGALARAGRVDHPAAADRIDSELVTHYRKAQATGERADLLAALGNSVGLLVVPVVESSVRDPNTAVRAAAVRALRLAHGAEIDSLLSTAITSDNDPGVRVAAILSASFRQPIGTDLCQALSRSAKTDAVEHVRSSAISLLRQNARTCPGTRETLAWVAAHDPKAGVQRLAHEALDSVSRE